MKLLITLVAFFAALFASNVSLARGGSGGHSLEFAIALANSSQTDIDSWIDSLGVAGTKNLPSGLEFIFDYQYRFSGTMYSMIFRPTYFTQSASGGSVSSSLTGFTLFPMLRMVPLENSFMKFFLQVGVGYGTLSGKLSNDNAGTTSAEFSGSAFGGIAGLGADFCFTPNHCLTLEGNFRYLPIPRNVASSASGSLGGMSQAGSGQELEFNGSDVATTMSGIQGVLGYTLNF